MSMLKLIVPGLAALALAACSGAPAADKTAAAEPATADAAATTARASYPDKAFKLMCGSEHIEVHFTDLEAHVTEASGAILTLTRLDGGPASYTNGRMTFARAGEGDAISFARGRMALQNCSEMAAPAVAAEPAAEAEQKH